MDGSPGPVRYTVSQGFSIAWQEFGCGPADIGLVWGNPNNIEALWEWPTTASFLRGLGRLGRTAHLDQRGSGLSDRVAAANLPELSERVQDVVAVLDAADMPQVTLIGESEGAPCAARLAATLPDRVERLILLAPTLRGHIPEDFREEALELIECNWGEPGFVELLYPEQAEDPRFREWWAKFLRISASPGEARALFEKNLEVNEMDTLAHITVPTLMLSHEEDPFCPADELEEAATRLANGSLVLVPGHGRAFGAGSGDEQALATIAEFLGQDRSTPTAADSRRRAILFTDIVGSTSRAARVGDRAWRELLDRHDRIMHQIIRSAAGDWLESTGDGFVATFPGSSDAIRASFAALEQLTALELEIRAGVHFGEVQLRGHGIAGLDVHIAARIAGKASAGQVLLSEPAAAELSQDHALSSLGRHDLKGVPGTWHLLSVT